MTDLLPPNATSQERALANVAADRVNGIAVPNASLWNPQTCPVAVLPWLAWAMSVDDWDSSWTEQQKRDVIAASVEVHRHKGTIGAMKAALRPLNYDIEVEEPPSLPYQFRIKIDAGHDVPMDISTLDYSRAQQIALRVKNVRSWLIGVQAMRKTSAGIFVGCAGLLGDVCSVWPYIVTDLITSNPLTFAMALHIYETLKISPPQAPARLTESGGYRLTESGGKRLLES
jgi:phage tail P2-like protein